MANQNDVKITERGWAGHFILGHRCLFHRNTLIESSKDSVVVSTVGSLMARDDDKKIESIGYNRYYETMVFGTTEQGAYIDADVSDERSFNSKWSINANSANQLPDDVDNIANDMHDAVIKEFVEKLRG